jgi:DNA-binding transcriptional MerR regulator
MAQDFAYQQMYRVAREAGLGIPAAREIYSLRQHAEQQMAEIRLAPDLAQDEQTHLIENVRAASAQSIEALIGEAGRAQLEQARNDRWLETLLSLRVEPAAGPP